MATLQRQVGGLVQRRDSQEQELAQLRMSLAAQHDSGTVGRDAQKVESGGNSASCVLIASVPCRAEICCLPFCGSCVLAVHVVQLLPVPTRKDVLFSVKRAASRDSVLPREAASVPALASCRT